MSQTNWRSKLCAYLAAPGMLASALPAIAGEPYPYTDEWWAMRAQDPPGARQVEKDGKLWPPFARPVGEKQHWKHKYHHAHYWPHPYNCDDQAYVRNIIDQQASGGWVTATTLHDYHFDPETHELNSVGRDHLYWIVNAAPVQHRTVYIAMAMASAEDSLRQASVEKNVQEFQPGGSIPVLMRYDRFKGRSAQEIDQLRRLELQSIPRPRLFIVGTAGRNSSGAAGSSAQAGGTSGQSSGSNTGTTR